MGAGRVRRDPLEPARSRCACWRERSRAREVPRSFRSLRRAIQSPRATSGRGAPPRSRRAPLRPGLPGGRGDHEVARLASAPPRSRTSVRARAARGPGTDPRAPGPARGLPGRRHRRSPDRELRQSHRRGLGGDRAGPHHAAIPRGPRGAWRRPRRPAHRQRHRRGGARRGRRPEAACPRGVGGGERAAARAPPLPPPPGAPRGCRPHRAGRPRPEPALRARDGVPQPAGAPCASRARSSGEQATEERADLRCGRGVGGTGPHAQERAVRRGGGWASPTARRRCVRCSACLPAGRGAWSRGAKTTAPSERCDRRARGRRRREAAPVDDLVD